jgi:hypothetical protein
MGKIADMQKGYHRPTNFQRVIACATIYHEIQAGDYVTCQAEIIYPEREIPQFFQEPKLAIIFHPLATVEEIKTVFAQKKIGIVNQYESEVLRGTVLYKDVSPKIKRTRRCYWWKRDGDSWSKIYTRVKTQFKTEVTQDAIRNSVRRYQELLEVEI